MTLTKRSVLQFSRIEWPLSPHRLVLRDFCFCCSPIIPHTVWNRHVSRFGLGLFLRNSAWNVLALTHSVGWWRHQTVITYCTLQKPKWCVHDVDIRITLYRMSHRTDGSDQGTGLECIQGSFSLVPDSASNKKKTWSQSQTTGRLWNWVRPGLMKPFFKPKH